jgi:NADPH:quinone reductase-like Zn-dependent oxidoreductase
MSSLTGAEWTIEPELGFDGLKLNPSVPIPEPQGSQCLIRLEAASLNYRDIGMALGNYPIALKPEFVPVSDGAGTILSTGPAVTTLKPGDRVVPAYFQGHTDGLLTQAARATSLGHPLDGVLRQYALFDAAALVPVPARLSAAEAATLPCAGVTAWNALFGIPARRLQRGQTLLAQGTGGVSLFAIQLALAVGATVIATTSSAEKEARLRELGVQHVVNYQTDVNWGETAKRFSPDGLGAHHVIEVTGDLGLPQSLKAVRVEGTISVVGFLGGAATPVVGTEEIMQACCLIRGVHVGLREQLVELMEFMGENRVRPIISKPVFEFSDARGAYEQLKKQSCWGKIAVKIE